MPYFFAVACFCWIFFLLEYEGLSVPFSGLLEYEVLSVPFPLFFSP